MYFFVGNVKNMTHMLLKEPEQEDPYEFQDLIINQSEKGLKNLLLEIIEISRFNRIFKTGYGGECKING